LPFQGYWGPGGQLVLLVVQEISKFLVHIVLRNAEKEKERSERDKKPIYTMVSKEIQTEPDEGHAQYHQEDYPEIVNGES
jgi:chemotaxis regulatin CheY-phosphate phosphatase CheZ